MSSRRTPSPFVPSGFFALRTPLLAFDELERWSEGLESATADPATLEETLARDRSTLRARLLQLLERPEIAEALFLATPGLFQALERWRNDPASRKGKRAEDSLVRYFQRMASRPTPFGLFSGCSLGDVDGSSETRLRLAPQSAYQRHSRIDGDYLFGLCEDLARDPALRRELVYQPNSSLYRAAGRLRYAEARLAGQVRSHHLVALDSTPFLDAALQRASAGAPVGAPVGATLAQLAAAVVAADADGEVALDDAEAYVHELIDAQVLVCELTPAVTGPEPIEGVEQQLAGLPSGRAAASALARAREALAALDAQGLGVPADRYLAVAEDLKALPATVELSRLYQVDMVKPLVEATLGAAIVEEIERGLSIMHRLAPPARRQSLEQFRKDFVERYGERRWVPLAEVLDEETGIGFERGPETSPLLEGLALGGAQSDSTVAWGALQSWQLRKVEVALARGEQEIELTEKDVDELARREPQAQPDALEVMVRLAAASEEDANAGRFDLFWKSAGGPSGVRMLGRFCHVDAELEARVREHVAAEEAARPDAVFAEVVHMPQGRTGNIIARPVLRTYEIPVLGRSGAPVEQQVPWTDLQVTVREQRIVLRSERLGREVIPRLTSAHNFLTGIGAYRFLCTLQDQGVVGGLTWHWGPLEALAFLPRVRSGRLILRRAQWKVFRDEIAALCSGSSADRFAAVQRLRAERRLPRYVVLADSDNELLVDFDNVLSVEAWLDLLDGRQEVTLIELFPDPERLCARGPEGRFVNELVVPFVRSRETAAAAVAAPFVRPVPADAIQRSFLPGSEWLYAKLYLGSSTADAVLRDVVAPLTRDVQAAGAADSWFFIRYGDPHWHLRLRLHGAPRRLTGEVLPILEAVVAPLLADGRLWRMQFDTYDRELERYGGAAGIGLCERLFHADSEAVVSILDLLEGDDGADARWRLAVCGIDLFLEDLGMDAHEKCALLAQMRDNFLREYGGGKSLRIQLDLKQRKEQRALEALLSAGASTALAPALAVLKRRATQNAPILAGFRRLEQARRLTMPMTQIAASVIHMQINRLIRSDQRGHELVIYDLLSAIYESRRARAARTGKAALVGR